VPKVETIELGRIVLCDSCSSDYTASDEPGGILFGSNACCPVCAPQMEISALKYNEEKYIKDRAMPGESFRDFVYRIRGGDGSAVTTITSYEAHEGEQFIEDLKKR
jgi:hydrogenase maturation factor HypF (carbamoyltransferase family)